MKKALCRGFITCLSIVALSACQDYDAGFDAETIKKAEYDKHFVKTFGEVDPEQDWSMAATLTADITVGSNPSVMIYSAKPGYASSKPLGLIKGSSGKFDALKGIRQVYAVVSDGSKNLVEGYYDVVDGVVCITDKPLSTRSIAVTRGENDPTRSENPIFTHQTYDPEATWDGKTYLVDPWNDKHLFYAAQEGEEWFLYYAPDTNTAFRKLAHNATDPNNSILGYHNNTSDAYYADGNQEKAYSCYWPDLISVVDGKLHIKLADNENEYTQKSSKYLIRTRYDGKYYTISGNTKTDDAVWKIGDCSTLFWDGDACFRESEDFRSARKQAVYAQHGATVADLQRCVEFTTVEDNQNINIPMMYGATVKQNIFGYYYYRKTASGANSAQDPRTVNRYVLFDDAQPSSNIKVDGTAVGGMTLQSRQSAWTDDSEVTCTTRRLVWFGEKGENTTGTFNFPAGVTIGFFIMKKPTTADYQNLNGCSGFESWAYSNPSLNQQYFYDKNGKNQTLVGCWGYTYGNDVVAHNYGTVGEDGRVKAISWQYGNRILVGFGDNSGDEDLNDFVFWYDGKVDEEEKPKIKITTNTTTNKAWVFACEDLGGSFDYDFNDIVWEVSQEYQTTSTTVDGETTTNTTYGDMKINLLASGGTLPVEILYDNVSLGETHQSFGQSEATIYQPVNVGTGMSHAPVTLKTVSASSEMNISTLKSLFTIKVSNANGGTTYITAPKNGESDKADKTPQVLILPGGWDWPNETVPIDQVYGNFASWVKDSEVTTWCNTKNGNQSSAYTTNPSKPTGGSTTTTTEEEIPGGNSGGGAGGGSGSGSGSGNGQNTPTVPDLSSYGTTISPTTDDKGNKYYSKDLFSGYETATVTFVVSSIPANSTTYISIHKNNQWFDNFTSSPVLKKIDGTVVSNISESGTYQLVLSSANLTELASYDGIIFQNMSISAIVVSGQEKTTSGGNASGEDVYAEYGTQISLVDGKDSNPALVSKADVLKIKDSGDVTITFICESNNGGGWINWSNDGANAVGGAGVEGTSIAIGSSVISGTSYYPVTITASATALSGCGYSYFGISLWNNAKVVQVRVK